MTGNHRKDRFSRGNAPAPARGEWLETRAAGEALTIGELRDFIARAESAAAGAGTDAGSLRPSVVVRHTGAIKAIWLDLPR